MKTFFLFLLLSVCEICPAWCQQPLNGATQISREQRQRTLSNFLWLMGTRLDCYFTFEDGHSDEDGASLYQMRTWQVDIASIPDLVSYINGLGIGLSCYPDDVNSKIVHIQHDLTKTEKKALDKRIELSHIGSPSSLMNRISTLTGGEVRNPRIYFFPILGIDELTLENIPSVQNSIREILSNSLPLSRYRRILWTSTGHDDSNRTEIWVKFGDPLSAASGIILMRGVAGDRQITFSDGELAYYLIPHTDKSVLAAVNFIVGELKDPNPVQVRWAILFLGKYKVTSAIPILLKAIDYQYCLSPLVEERYPAIRALTEVGAPAAEQALAALGSETAPLRQELLCRVIIGVDGPINGKAAIDEVLTKVADAHQKAQLQAALDRALIPGPTATVPAYADPPATSVK